MSFFGEKIILPSAPVPGINYDQSLKVWHLIFGQQFLIDNSWYF